MKWKKTHASSQLFTSWELFTGCGLYIVHGLFFSHLIIFREEMSLTSLCHCTVVLSQMSVSYQEQKEFGSELKKQERNGSTQLALLGCHGNRSICMKAIYFCRPSPGMMSWESVRSESEDGIGKVSWLLLLLLSILPIYLSYFRFAPW